ncbi:hypothetical protein LWI28_016146 [Acer negundo]|uniref:Uncharacterized protein n=1 Tax=Acer negundo TaxID=4023 RepID=A0AAD5I6X1_ACENE|nr:hypothetical protein LWI28_016146 [Acer negundo]
MAMAPPHSPFTKNHRSSRRLTPKELPDELSSVPNRTQSLDAYQAFVFEGHSKFLRDTLIVGRDLGSESKLANAMVEIRTISCTTI